MIHAFSDIEDEVRYVLAKTYRSPKFEDSSLTSRTSDLTEFGIELDPNKNPFYNRFNELMIRDGNYYFGRRIKDNTVLIALERGSRFMPVLLVGLRFSIHGRSHIVSSLLEEQGRLSAFLEHSRRHDYNLKPEPFHSDPSSFEIEPNASGDEIKRLLEEHAVNEGPRFY